MSKAEKILITGGAGFIGSHLSDRLLELGYQVIVLDNLVNGSMENLEASLQHKAFRFIKGDILIKEDCRKACEDIDIIFHLACLGVRHSIHSPFENHRVNAEGTLNMLEASLKNNVSHFYYISTSEVYGKTTVFPITEEAPVNPVTVYGASKLAGENYAHAYMECYGMNTTVLRIFNNYGPRAHYEGDAGEVIPRSIVRVLNGLPPVIFGDGSVTRDFYYVKDTAKALSGLPGKPEITGGTYNIGTGKEISMKVLLEILLKEMGSENIGIEYMKDRPADVPRLWVNPGKFESITGFIPSRKLEDGLRETVEYYTKLNEKAPLLPHIKLENWK